MSWFDGIKEDTLLKITLENGKEIDLYFIKISNGIVEGKLKNGKLKKFKEDKIEDLEEIETNVKDIILDSNEETTENNNTEKKVEVSSNQTYTIKTSFINKIDNSILSPIDFKGKESLLVLKDTDKTLYSKAMSILNQFENAKRINELDSKFGRSTNIIRKLNDLLEEEYTQEIDIFLAYVLYECDISYYESLKKLPKFFYCLKHDIYYFNIKNNKYGFIVAEKLFELYKLDNNIENEWIYLIKNIPNFNSFKTLQYQFNFKSKMSEKYQNLLDESINYIFVKLKITNKSNSIKEQIELLKNNFQITNDYKNLEYLNSKIKEHITSKTSINLDLSNEGLSSINESFYEFMQPKIEEELRKILPPNGIITRYFSDRNFGFIEDRKGINYYFTAQNIADKEILTQIKNSYNTWQNIEVCFSISSNYKGDVADAIQKPKQINEILDNISKFTKNGYYNVAKKLLEQILSIYPNNLKVKTIYGNLISSKPKQYSNYTRYENYSSYGNYRKAKDAQLKKNYETAIKYFKIALENNEKVESTIKDLTISYYESGDIENSKKFLLQNENRLSKIATTYNFLENHYFAVGEYNKSIEYIDILLKNTYNKNKEIILLGKKANCYIKLNNKNSAIKTLQEILTLQPDNGYAKKLLNEIKIGKSLDDIDISSFGGGLSKFIEITLNSYEDYVGVPPKVVEKQDFQIGTLKELRRIIKEAGKARPKERANYLLSEAKLMQLLEPDKDNNQRSILARYCNAMAQSHISENSPKEVIRFYYLEAFNLEENYRSLANHVSFYLLTYVRNYNELLNTKDTSIDNVFNELLFSNNKLFWNGLIDMFIWNETITKHLIKKLFDTKTFREQAIKFLEQSNVKFGSNNLENFTKSWDEIREKRKRNYDDWFIKIRSLLKVTQLESLNDQMKLTLESLDTSWLSDFDKHRLNILKEINSNLDDYLKQKTFDDKERAKNYLITKINEQVDEINKYPTKFSYEGYKPLLEFIEKLINISFDDILKASIPNIKIEQLGDSVIENKIIFLQLSLQNSKNSSPISNIEIQIVETPDIKFIQGDTEIYNSIRGGENKILKFKIEVKDKIIKNLATDIGVIIKYNRRGQEEKEEAEFQIPIRLYTSEKFEKIQNVYSPLAEGGAVTDKSMFYGREEYINNIVNSLTTSNSKSIIVYGQKRSGKTSVLYHLKKSLEEKENAFCISFSMGEIVENLSSTTLYDKILEKIDEELENLESDGYEVPNFKKPSISELEKYPANIFNESLKEFNKSLKKLNSWKNKKLVILIDEFTYVYTSIEKGELNSNFMKSWKAFIEKEYFSAVLIGQDVAPKFKQKFPNEFGVTEDKRLTYLSEIDAKKLIEEPIWNKDRDSSRYIGKAVDRIIDYTACSPYYLQMFCARVVDYMNRNKAISVTESDIEEIANTFIDGTESLSEDKFDNLFTAGDADLEAFDLKDVENVLIQIAKKTDIGTCSRDDIHLENIDEKRIDKILEDLKTREVIQQKNSFYQIKVGLFEKWLLKRQ